MKAGSLVRSLNSGDRYLVVSSAIGDPDLLWLRRWRWWDNRFSDRRAALINKRELIGNNYKDK